MQIVTVFFFFLFFLPVIMYSIQRGRCQLLPFIMIVLLTVCVKKLVSYGSSISSARRRRLVTSTQHNNTGIMYLSSSGSRAINIFRDICIHHQQQQITQHTNRALSLFLKQLTALVAYSSPLSPLYSSDL